MFHFASGGHGWSIPYGTVKIEKDSEGGWGKRHDAFDLTGKERGTIYDPQLGRDREGIEIHPSDHYASAGCVVVAKKVYAEVKERILAIIKDAGHAFLHVTPKGAAITASDEPPTIPDDLKINVAKNEDDTEVKRERHARHHRVAHHRHVRYASG